MKIEILQIAKQEFKTAQEYYEMEQTGLGSRFEMEIRQALLRIQQYPRVWSTEQKEIRRCFIHKFPYKVIYSIQNEIIIILAFAHLHRKPDYWVDRVK
jgi:hypothetical protein